MFEFYRQSKFRLRPGVYKPVASIYECNALIQAMHARVQGAISYYFTPASFLSFAALSVFSQVNSGSVLPKCPYAAVFL